MNAEHACTAVVTDGGHRSRSYLLSYLWLLTAAQTFAQVYAPATITRDASGGSNRTKVVWQTVPGKNYEVLTADQLGQPWMATNGSAIKARTTLTNFTDTANRLTRFCRIREQTTPPGNNGSITATTVTEAERILGLTFTTSQRNQMLQLLTSLQVPKSDPRRISFG